jgi:NADH:ubiquinone oxidoreductase subunit 2 (subunit N)
MYAATAAVTAASTALSVIGTACFFMKTNKMKLAQMENKLGEKEEFEINHFHPQ